MVFKIGCFPLYKFISVSLTSKNCITVGNGVLVDGINMIYLVGVVLDQRLLFSSYGSRA